MGALDLYDTPFAPRGDGARWETVYMRRKRGGMVAARIQRGDAGAWAVSVRPHEQTPAEAAELAEQVEALLAEQMSRASGVRLGRRLAGALTADEARESQRDWLEGCVWAMARGSGLDWDRIRCAVVADTLRQQRDGWQAAVACAVGGSDWDSSGE